MYIGIYFSLLHLNSVYSMTIFIGIVYTSQTILFYLLYNLKPGILMRIVISKQQHVNITNNIV